jgi:hypothetical protein
VDRYIELSRPNVLIVFWDTKRQVDIHTAQYGLGNVLDHGRYSKVDKAKKQQQAFTFRR